MDWLTLLCSYGWHLQRWLAGTTEEPVLLSDSTAQLPANIHCALWCSTPHTPERPTCGDDLAIVAGGVAVKHCMVALPLPASLCHLGGCSAASCSGTCRHTSPPVCCRYSPVMCRPTLQLRSQADRSPYSCKAIAQADPSRCNDLVALHILQQQHCPPHPV